MQTYDWIVIGGGISGASLGYELAKTGVSVLLIEQSETPPSATQFSYGGIAYWSGTTEITRQLCQEGIALHRALSAELESDTQFREVDLLLTIDAGADGEAIASIYSQCLIPPTLIDADQAAAIEPLLNRQAIAGALHTRHGHVEPMQITAAYRQAMVRLGGAIAIDRVTGIAKNGKVQGIVTATGTTYSAGQVVVCAGGMSRALLRDAGIPVRLYYTQAELIDIPATDLRLNSLVMPADLKRFPMEAKAGSIETEALWDDPGQEIVPPIFDAGVVQFADGRIRLGQISRALADPNATVDAIASERTMRDGIGQIVPKVQDLPGQWHSCLVAFSGDRLPLIGALPQLDGLYIFSGFSNPFAVLPPLARRFAQHLAGQPDSIIPSLSPTRLG